MRKDQLYTALHKKLFNEDNYLTVEQWLELEVMTDTIFDGIHNAAMEQAAEICDRAVKHNNGLSQTRCDERKHPDWCKEEILRYRVFPKQRGTNVYVPNN
jgi:hypothetical protein